LSEIARQSEILTVLLFSFERLELVSEGKGSLIRITEAA
jgi:hypothetical protein